MPSTTKGKTFLKCQIREIWHKNTMLATLVATKIGKEVFSAPSVSALVQYNDCVSETNWRNFNISTSTGT